MGTKQIISKNISADSTQYIGKDGELWVDTVTNKMKISDGTTPGGVDLAGGGGGGGATTWAAITDINNANGPGKVAIGRNAGSVNQGTETVAIGDDAGKTNQGDNSYALGNNAGATDQGASSVAIGDVAASANQGTLSVAIGANAGTTTQGQQAVAIGGGAGFTNQGDKTVAVGFAAGVTNQGTESVALGYEAGEVTQGTKAVAIGYRAGETTQGNSTVAIGDSAGETTQSQHGVAIGALAGQTTQGESSVAIGKNAGKVNQGSSAIAIGNLAGVNNQHNNSIVIAASGSELETTQTGQFIVKPIASAVGATMLMYDATSGQVTHTATPLITGDLAVEEGFSFTPTNKYFEVETGAGNNRIMRSGINMSTFGQSIAPEIDLTAYRASPADGDAGPELTFRASTAGSSNSVIATIETKVIATASGAVTTKVSIRNVNAGTSVTPFTITGNTVYSASHISIADLKILVAAAVDFADYKTLIAAL